MLGEDLRLAAEAVKAAVEVGVLGVLGGDPQGLLLPAARDPQRDAAVLERQRLADRAADLVVLAVEGGRAGRPELAHDLDALVQHADAVARPGSRNRRRATHARTSPPRCPSRPGRRRSRLPSPRPWPGTRGCGSRCRCTSGRALPGWWRRRTRPSASTPRAWPPAWAPARCGSGRRPRSSRTGLPRPALAMPSMVAQCSLGSMPARSSRHPCGTKSPKRMAHHPRWEGSSPGSRRRRRRRRGRGPPDVTGTQRLSAVAASMYIGAAIACPTRRHRQVAPAGAAISAASLGQQRCALPTRGDAAEAAPALGLAASPSARAQLGGGPGRSCGDAASRAGAQRPALAG